MDAQKINDAIGHIDIYVIDQILKNRYMVNESILDAGCGEGRNLKWFYANDFNIYGIDADEDRIDYAKTNYPKASCNFSVGNLDTLPYKNNQFNHIICSAVLHFATNETHFFCMFNELLRVLKPNGTLLIRTASLIGLDGNVPNLVEQRTNRAGTFYITRTHIKKLLEENSLELLEPVKTTNVEDKRAMTTLLFCKL